MTVNRAWNSRFIGWSWDETARPEARRRSVPSNFAATPERIPMGISGLEIKTSAIINRILEVYYEFWNMIPYFRITPVTGEKGLGAGDLIGGEHSG